MVHTHPKHLNEAEYTGKPPISAFMSKQANAFLFLMRMFDISAQTVTNGALRGLKHIGGGSLAEMREQSP